jgi:hypothetical protein
MQGTRISILIYRKYVIELTSWNASGAVMDRMTICASGDGAGRRELNP